MSRFSSLVCRGSSGGVIRNFWKRILWGPALAAARLIKAIERVGDVGSVEKMKRRLVLVANRFISLRIQRSCPRKQFLLATMSG